MNSILKRYEEDPVDLTYFGIGSAPHLTADKSLEPKHDQLIPSCFHETILRDKKSVRILHMDPHFDSDKPFLDKYFAKWNLVPMEFEQGYSWINDNLEVIVLPRSIEHTDHYVFFATLVNRILNTKGKLVIQEFTGYSLDTLNKSLYDSCLQKEKYKRRILLDMTFGTDSGCSSDMTAIQPFYDYDGNFLNFHFADEDYVKRWVGISFKLDDILRKKYTGKYCQTLNTIHVDYRRKAKGDTLMYGFSGYNESSSPEEIMSILQDYLRKYFEILVLVRGAKKASQETLDHLFQNYKNNDPYKWYDAAYKLIDRP